MTNYYVFIITYCTISWIKYCIVPLNISLSNTRNSCSSLLPPPIHIHQGRFWLEHCKYKQKIRLSLIQRVKKFNHAGTGRRVQNVRLHTLKPSASSYISISLNVLFFFQWKRVAQFHTDFRAVNDNQMRIQEIRPKSSQPNVYTM